MIPSLLKWIGNKQRFAAYIVNHFPSEFGDYYEPFMGSAAILAEVKTRANESLPGFGMSGTAYASDALPFLVDIFNLVKNDPESLISYYRTSIDAYANDPEGQYLAIRDRFNENHNALDFCLLSRTCYSGIIRFRKTDGYMSTPRGPHKPISPDAFESRVRLWQSLVNDVQFDCMDFRESMARAKAGDLVYCDPPYTHSQSIIYGAQAFDINDLWNAIDECKSRGVFVALSINGTRKSKTEDIGVQHPEGLFERSISVDCGKSMIDRLQKTEDHPNGNKVHDKLMLTW